MRGVSILLVWAVVLALTGAAAAENTALGPGVSLEQPAMTAPMQQAAVQPYGQPMAPGQVMTAPGQTMMMVPQALPMVTPSTIQPMQTAQQAAQVQSEHLRCARTCNTYTSHYQARYPQMRSHEGDQTCWETCWQRFGASGTAQTAVGGTGNLSQMKTFWAARRPMNMKSNLCAQACWRNFHGRSMRVEVAGWTSDPRPAQRCFGEAARLTGAIPFHSAPITSALVLGTNSTALLPSAVPLAQGMYMPQSFAMNQPLVCQPVTAAVP